MRQYILRRLVYVPLIMAIVSVLAFFTLRIPWAIDPVTLYVNQNTTLEQEQEIRRELGLDKPPLQQFVIWLGQVARGDLGETFRSRQPVWQEIARRLPVTLEILILSIFFSTLFGVTFGVITAVKQNTPIDYLFRFFAVFGQSIPDFFLLILLIVLPSIWWNYSPPVGGHIPFTQDPLENLRLYLPPTILLGVGGAAAMMRLTRSSLLEVFRQDYMRTARAKGLPGRAVVLKHGLRNTLIPIITLIGGQVTALFFGSLILEQVFSINGLGQFFLVSSVTGDFPVIQTLVLYTAFVVMVMNLLVDISYALIDPRVKYT
ncbi:MAG: glutathione ABC transporter permease [Tepidiforma sp.]|nr:ABC transporter permease [Tepidiforma sp.]GIW18294.1 MAG: glutathione ABC transporter permease [Tepidiforma sp.]